MQGLAGLGALNASLSGSKLVWGTAAIVASLGSRFIITELTPGQQNVFKTVAFKRLALFAMLFLPTRDLLLSAALTVVVSVLLEVLLNENSSFCWLPDCARKHNTASATPASLPLASRAPILGMSAGPRRMNMNMHMPTHHARTGIDASSSDDYKSLFGI